MYFAPACPWKCTVEVSVNNGVDFISDSVMIEVRALITLSSLVPTAGPLSGGTHLMIRGSRFRATDLILCDFYKHADTTAERALLQSVPGEYKTDFTFAQGHTSTIAKQRGSD
jgi:hypothetical protein